MYVHIPAILYTTLCIILLELLVHTKPTQSLIASLEQYSKVYHTLETEARSQRLPFQSLPTSDCEIH